MYKKVSKMDRGAFEFVKGYLKENGVRLENNMFRAVLSSVSSRLDGETARESNEWAYARDLIEFYTDPGDIKKVKKELQTLSAGVMKFIDKEMIEEKKEMQAKIAKGAEGFVVEVSRVYLKRIGFEFDAELLAVIRDSAKKQLRGKNFKESSLEAFESIRESINEEDVEDILLTIQYLSREVKIKCLSRLEELKMMGKRIV